MKRDDWFVEKLIEKCQNGELSGWYFSETDRKYILQIQGDSTTDRVYCKKTFFGYSVFISGYELIARFGLKTMLFAIAENTVKERAVRVKDAKLSEFARKWFK